MLLVLCAYFIVSISCVVDYRAGQEGAEPVEVIIPTRQYGSYKLNWQLQGPSVSDSRPEREKEEEGTREKKWVELSVHFLPRPRVNQVNHWTSNVL